MFIGVDVNDVDMEDGHDLDDNDGEFEPLQDVSFAPNDIDEGKPKSKKTEEKVDKEIDDLTANLDDAVSVFHFTCYGERTMQECGVQIVYYSLSLIMF